MFHKLIILAFIFGCSATAHFLFGVSFLFHGRLIVEACGVCVAHSSVFLPISFRKMEGRKTNEQKCCAALLWIILYNNPTNIHMNMIFVNTYLFPKHKWLDTCAKMKIGILYQRRKNVHILSHES